MRAATRYVLKRFLISITCGLGGCAQDAEAGPVVPWAPAALGPAPLVVAEEDGDFEARVALGRLLFYDPVLSADRDTACATCHSEIWGMSDGLSLSVGTGGSALTGPGRTGDNMTNRNAQTLWNAAYRESLFWDGRAASLEEQALMPLEEDRELGRDPAEVAAELRTFDDYPPLFEAAFPGAQPPITPAHLAAALSSFQRTLVTDRAPYDRYLAGDPRALDDASLRGMWLFAEAGCADCHSPPRFEREAYFDRRVPASQGVAEADAGRTQATGEAADRRRFRVPTLRNLRETGPYFHAGQVRGMRAAVAHEVAQQVQDGVIEPLSEAELDDLCAFLSKALMDRSREPDRPSAVPSGLQVPIDGFRIPR